ncbi:uncharacterized protein LOC110712784 [Chenopodium quinoa]|uniref:RING-type domain-containing protein n=1 Tax=Chenopodium quinoa TaxID=63459 RepID=A0A803L1S7_CHEQI|nr:uncharacterized protein LOC110712784 [Chenopodium quinoa]
MGPHEPYWRTNTSFSPPPSRWDYGFQPEGIQYGSSDSIQLFGSTSSNSKESRSWIRGGYHPTHHYSASEGGALYFSSPSDASFIQPWTPPPVRGVSIDEFETSARRGTISGPLSFTPTMEGTSVVRDGGGFTSPRSDGSEFEHIGKHSLSTPRNFPSHRAFISKPVHPLSFPVHSFTREVSASPAAGLPAYDATTPQSDSHRLSSGSSSIDLTDVSERLESEFLARTSNANEGFKCGLCDRLLSQRSPWSSRRIVKSEDMPVAGVLSCRHVFHAECLDQTTPKSHKNDPPCPICSKLEREYSPEQHTLPRLRNNFPRLRTFSEEGSSRTWGCVQASDCVEGALHTPQKSSMFVLSRQKIKNSFSHKGNTGKDFPSKLKKTSSHPLHLFGGRFSDYGAGGCSKTAAGPSIKKG